MTEQSPESDVWPNASKVPLVFGVSGHRDLVSGDIPQLRSQIEVVFSQFRTAYPNVPFELLSPLAEGADRLVAEVALSFQISLRVPMPMPQKEYERDFPDQASLNEFRRLLAEADSHWEIPSDNKKSSPEGEGQTRSGQYAAVGDYIARKSHVLILLWDGRDNKKVGGTAWVKKRREHWVAAARDAGHAMDASGYGPTIQIVTPRLASPPDSQDRPRVEIIGDLP
jgi:hypothetical protein